MPYEKVGKNEPVCIADEVPFEIPDSWEWARLKNLVIKEIKRGKSPKYASDGSVYVFAQKCNVKLGEIDISLAKFLDMRIFEKYPVEEYMVDEDIIINSTGNGTLGRIGMFRDSDRINDSIIVPDSHMTIIRACNQLKKDYLFLSRLLKNRNKSLLNFWKLYRWLICMEKKKMHCKPITLTFRHDSKNPSNRKRFKANLFPKTLLTNQHPFS